MSRVDQLTPDSQKRCSDCGEMKSLEEFVRDRRRRVGRTLRPQRETPDGSRWCPECKIVKPISEFPKNRASTTGYGGYCKPCHNAKGKATYERLYGSTREYHLRRRYGITGTDFDEMVEAQGGTCAVCDQKPEHVDHDHETGMVRGILCFSCNQALGNVRDDPAVLQGPIDYLGRHRRKTLRIVVEEYPAPDGVIFEYLSSHRSA